MGLEGLDSLSRSSGNEGIFVPGVSDSTNSKDDTQAFPTPDEVEKNIQKAGDLRKKWIGLHLDRIKLKF